MENVEYKMGHGIDGKRCLSEIEINKLVAKSNKVEFVPDEFSGSDLEPFLNPLKHFNLDKQNSKDGYDDYNEYQHAKIGLLETKFPFLIYYITNKKEVVAVAFFTRNLDFPQPSIKLSWFHIMKNFRGLGKRWLNEVILPDLKTSGEKDMFIISSHPRSWNFYDSMGERIGSYERMSDNSLYKRQGVKWKVDIVKYLDNLKKITQI